MKPRLLVLLIFSSVVLSKNFAFAQVDHLATTPKLADHPRILLGKSEENALLRTVGVDQTWGKLHQSILTECDALLNQPPVERIKVGRRLLDKSREALRRLFFLSYAWRMTHQANYLKRAEQELLAVAAFSDWNPTHFLDVAEMTLAVSLGYDWLYSDLPEQSRSIIKAAILTKGLEPSLDNQYNSWLRASHNWNQVCNAGMTYGAIAIYEDQPELAKRIINRAIDSIILPMGDYSPSGAYPEGYSYWGYGTSFNVLFVSAVEKAFGTDFGLSGKPGFLQTADFMENMTGPSGNAFNYSDSGLGGELQPALFWFAQKRNDPSLLWVERSRLMNSDAKSYVRNRLLPAAILWSNGVGVSTVPEPKSTMWVGQGKTPVALMRTSWSDPNAIYVATKGGSASTNHAHMDIGSFVMEADGVRWAMDFGMQNYESLESKGVDLWNGKQDSQRWQVFRYSNFTHNTLTVNDQLQRVDGKAPITSSSKTPAFMNAITDLTAIYNGSLAKASRGIALVDQSYVVVRDELETLPSETTVRWTLLTPATVRIVDRQTVELKKDGKTLTLRVQEPASVTLKTWSTDPPHDYDAPNPGTTLVGFETRLPSAAKTALTVLLVPQRSTPASTQSVKPLDQWPK